MKSIITVINDGLPSVVVRLPRARKTRHISENTTQYIATKIAPFLSRCSAELSTVMTVMIAKGLIIAAMARGITTARS
jgi:hypothetical protein